MGVHRTQLVGGCPHVSCTWPPVLSLAIVDSFFKLESACQANSVSPVPCLAVCPSPSGSCLPWAHPLQQAVPLSYFFLHNCAAVVAQPQLGCVPASLRSCFLPWTRGAPLISSSTSWTLQHCWYSHALATLACLLSNSALGDPATDAWPELLLGLLLPCVLAQGLQ